MKLKNFNRELKLIGQETRMTNSEGLVAEYFPCFCNDGDCKSVHLTITNTKGEIEFKAWIYEDNDLPFINRQFKREFGSPLGFIELHNHLKVTGKKFFQPK